MCVYVVHNITVNNPTSWEVRAQFTPFVFRECLYGMVSGLRICFRKGLSFVDVRSLLEQRPGNLGSCYVEIAMLRDRQECDNIIALCGPTDYVAFG